MKDIRTKILLLSLFLSQFQTALGNKMSDWIRVDPEGVFFINKKLFPRDRHLRNVLEIQNLETTSIDGANSMELLTQYDCKKVTFRLLSHRAFSDSDLMGDLIYDWQGFDPRAFVGIPYKTPANKVFQLVCGHERKISLE